MTVYQLQNKPHKQTTNQVHTLLLKDGLSLKIKS